jgi:hypothetical protein
MNLRLFYLILIRGMMNLRRPNSGKNLVGGLALHRRDKNTNQGIIPYCINYINDRQIVQIKHMCYYL